MRRLGIDYGQFTINIQPDDYDTTQVHKYSFYSKFLEKLKAQPGTFQGSAISLAAGKQAVLAVMLLYSFVDLAGGAGLPVGCVRGGQQALLQASLISGNQGAEAEELRPKRKS